MKKLIPFFVLTAFLAAGCQQPEPEVHSVEIGLFTPYAVFPDILNGKVKEVTEKNYWAVEKDGKYEKGEIITEAARDTMGWTNAFRVMFDENGNLLKCENLDENDIIMNAEILSIKDNIAISVELVQNDTLRNITHLKYNEAGILDKFERYRMPEDTLVWYVMVMTDENGNMIEWEFFNPSDEATGKYVLTFNPEGKGTGYKYFNKEGVVTVEQKYTYNDVGQMSEQTVITKDGYKNITTYEYEYDKMNNWIKAVAKTGNQVIIEERTITYYED